jgi:hypothetical protein
MATLRRAALLGLRDALRRLRRARAARAAVRDSPTPPAERRRDRPASPPGAPPPAAPPPATAPVAAPVADAGARAAPAPPLVLTERTAPESSSPAPDAVLRQDLVLGPRRRRVVTIAMILLVVLGSKRTPPDTTFGNMNAF